MSDRANINFLKELNIAFKNESRDRIEETVDLVIKLTMDINPFTQMEGISNIFSVLSNYIKLIVKNKNVNANFVLSSVIKHQPPRETRTSRHHQWVAIPCARQSPFRARARGSCLQPP